MPRRVADYAEQFAGWNLFISLASFVLGLSTLIFVYNMVASWRGGPRAAANPWRALTLEWQVSSPPPVFNFDAVPTVVGGPYEYGVPGRGARHLPAGRGGTSQRPRRRAAGGASQTERSSEWPNVLVLAQRDDRRQAAARRDPRARASEGDAHFHVVVAADAPAPRQRDLRRGGARRRAGARRPRARRSCATRASTAPARSATRDPFNATMDALPSAGSTRSSSRRCRRRPRAGCGAT